MFENVLRNCERALGDPKATRSCFAKLTFRMELAFDLIFQTCTKCTRTHPLALSDVSKKKHVSLKNHFMEVALKCSPCSV